MPRKSSKKPVNKDAWLATYGDMITLVLVFFIYLFSISTIDAEKWQQIAVAIENMTNPGAAEQLLEPPSGQSGQVAGSDPATPTGTSTDVQELSAAQVNDIEELYQYFNGYVESNNMQEAVQVGKGEGFVIMRFEGSMFFKPDKADLLPGAGEALDVLTAGMGNIKDQIQLVRIDGHTATVDQPNSRSGAVNNRTLSTQRANAVLFYLEERGAIEAEKLIAVGYGRYRPIADNDTEEGRKKNRRVEIYISDQNSLGVNIDEVYAALAPEGS